MTVKMSDQEIHEKIRASLHYIAPEIDLNALKPDKLLRDQVDIDSIDFVRLVIRLHETLGVDVPERDYPRLATLDNCFEYFVSKLAEQNQKAMP